MFGVWAGAQTRRRHPLPDPPLPPAHWPTRKGREMRTVGAARPQKIQVFASFRAPQATRNLPPPHNAALYHSSRSSQRPSDRIKSPAPLRDRGGFFRDDAVREVLQSGATRPPGSAPYRGTYGPRGLSARRWLCSAGRRGAEFRRNSGSAEGRAKPENPDIPARARPQPLREVEDPFGRAFARAVSTKPDSVLAKPGLRETL